MLYAGITIPTPEATMADIDRESLQVIDPSPVEETPSTAEKQSYFPSTSDNPKATHHLGLSSQHSSIWYLSRIQKYSSYVFTTFAAA